MDAGSESGMTITGSGVTTYTVPLVRFS
jgi:hypothetical protein